MLTLDERLAKRKTCLECGVALFLLPESEHPGTCGTCASKLRVAGQCRRCGALIDAREIFGRYDHPLGGRWCVRCLLVRTQKRIADLNGELRVADDDEEDLIWERLHALKCAYSALVDGDYQRAANHLDIEFPALY